VVVWTGDTGSSEVVWGWYSYERSSNFKVIGDFGLYNGDEQHPTHKILEVEVRSSMTHKKCQSEYNRQYGGTQEELEGDDWGVFE
jgi:hypothetical protein